MPAKTSVANASGETLCEQQAMQKKPASLTRPAASRASLKV